MQKDAEETRLKDAMAEGKAEGLDEGLAEGELKKAKETALSMLSDGLPIETVSKYTGLSIQEIKSLKNSL
jgi:predicted transposase/invertase (TIGR01784 family)